jgi:gamma-glutamylcyclotransferase (GGCT)/AIG2-like uncharacterized protein YtfP
MREAFPLEAVRVNFGRIVELHPFRRQAGGVSTLPTSDDSPETRLASYGSLRPGQINHHQLAGLKGRWIPGTVQGKRIEAGWGNTIGFPGLVLDPSGPAVDVLIFESSDLPDHWSRLDEFEGSGYRRVVTRVRTAEGGVNAYIYVLVV